MGTLLASQISATGTLPFFVASWLGVRMKNAGMAAWWDELDD